jgi:hypothetical protein
MSKSTQARGGNQGERSARTQRPVEGQRPAKGQPKAAAEAAYAERPRTILIAVRLMYAGAVLTAIGLIADVIQIAMATFLGRHGHHLTAQQEHATKSALITSVIFSGLIEIGLWIFTARANRAGLSWARVIASVLAGASTILTITTVLGSTGITQKVFMAVTWLVGVAAVYFLWQRASSDYFGTPSAPSSSTAPARPLPRGRSAATHRSAESGRSEDPAEPGTAKRGTARSGRSAGSATSGKAADD